MKTPRWWQNHTILSAALTPLSWLYAAGAALDRYTTKSQRAALPTLAIGNITAGGAGKTPTAIALATLLHQAGLNPHFITRGYGGTARDATRVMPDSDWRIVGDEPLLLARTAPTWVCRQRLIAAQHAVQHGAQLAIADDALQHYALHAEINLLVIDGVYGLGNGKLLPAGPLRETLAQAQQRCHAVILIGEDKHQLASQITLPIFHASLNPRAPYDDLQHRKWFAFAGLARPEKFYDTLRTHGANLAATQNFPDHYAYTAQDLSQLRRQAHAMGAHLITTEKDWVKFPFSERQDLKALAVDLHFQTPDKLFDFLMPLIFPQKRPL